MRVWDPLRRTCAQADYKQDGEPGRAGAQGHVERHAVHHNASVPAVRVQATAVEAVPAVRVCVYRGVSAGLECTHMSLNRAEPLLGTICDATSKHRNIRSITAARNNQASGCSQELRISMWSCNNIPH